MDNQMGFNEDKALKKWFRLYYIKWMETCENLRWTSSGKEVKYPESLMPFIPYGIVPSLPYTNLLITFIDVQIGKLAQRLEHPLGNPAHMASIINDDGTDPINYKQPYILVEEVYGGVVTDYAIFKGKTWHQVVCELRSQGISKDYQNISKKIVKTSFLRKIFNLHEQWLVHGDNARYLIDFLFTLLDGIEKGDAKIEPKMPMLENFMNIRKQIKLKGIDVRAKVLEHSELIPNLLIEGRRGEIPISLGGKHTLVISENALFSLLDGFKFNNNLADLTSYFLEFLGRSLRTGEIKISGLRWLSKISAWYFKRRVYALPKKVQLLSKIMADPFRLMVIINNRIIVLTMKNGLPVTIKSVDLEIQKKDTKSLTLKDYWLLVCKEYEFIHIAITLKEPRHAKWYTIRPLVDLGFIHHIDVYPKNDFVRFFIRKMPLNLIFNAVLPFLSA